MERNRVPSGGITLCCFAARSPDGVVTSSMIWPRRIIALHTQVNSVETELRDMKHTKLHARVADLEEKVFGETRT
jgi:hypothetical protein